MYCGILVCAACGARMTYRSNTKQNKNGTSYTSETFNCGSYRASVVNCTGHFINVKGVDLIVKTALTTLKQQLIEDEEALKPSWKALLGQRRRIATLRTRN